MDLSEIPIPAVQNLANYHETLSELLYSESQRNFQRIDESIIVFVEKDAENKLSSPKALAGLQWAAVVGQKNYHLHDYPHLLPVARSNAEATDIIAKDIQHSNEETFILSSNAVLAARFQLIAKINKCFSDNYQIVNLTESDKTYSLAFMISQCRGYLFNITTKAIVDDAILKSQSGGNRQSLNLSRALAQEQISKGNCDIEGRWSLFGQGFRALHGQPCSDLRSTEQLWRVTYTGEQGSDAGGLYRDSLTCFSKDIMSRNLPLLIESSNTRSTVDDERALSNECWVLNPHATSTDQIQMFEFVGKLMGIAARQKNYMDIALAPMVWKEIVGESVDMRDYRLLNKREYDMWTTYKTKSPEQFNIDRQNGTDIYSDCLEPILFVVTSLGGKTVELHPGGALEEVNGSNVQRYCNELETYRLREMDVVAAAIRRGLSTQLPPIVLLLSKWSDFERRVCGSNVIDVKLLKRMTTSSYSSDDSIMIWFWEILNEISQEDLKSYLIFCWGRSRLPLTAADFGDRRMSINRLSGSDRALPCSHTCSFAIDLPR